MDTIPELVTLDRARAFFQGDRFAADAGMTIEDAAPGRAVIRLTLTEAHQNARGFLMGGVPLTMADFACAVASHYGPGAGLWVSADAHVSFLNPCRGRELVAEATCLKRGRKLSWYEVLIRDETDVPVAKATFPMCAVHDQTTNVDKEKGT